MIRSIISILLGLFVRIWILRQVFSQQKKNQILGITLRSIFYALAAFFVYNISHFISQFPTDYYTYIIIITILSLFFIPLLPQGWKVWILQSLGRIIVSLGVGWIIGKYSLSARGEESLKRSSLKNNQSWLIQSMILGWIISWIVFWRIENIIYTVTQYLQTQDISLAINLLGQRSFLPLIVHVWSISLWFCIILLMKKNFSLKIAQTLGIFSIIWSHLLYNMSQVGSLPWWIKVILMAIYLVSIHYALFRSDDLYISEKEIIKS